MRSILHLQAPPRRHSRRWVCSSSGHVCVCVCMYCVKAGSVYTASKPPLHNPMPPGVIIPGNTRLDHSLVRPGDNAPHHL